MENIQYNKFYGYYEITPKPTEENLRDYYEKKYYQNEQGSYAKQYSEEELSYFFNKIKQKDFVIEQMLKYTNNRSLLDIGCGEGFTLKYYQKKGWDITGLDFSEFGIKYNNPQLLQNLIKGDISKEINKLVKNGLKYDVVWLDNVLEHVINPEKLIEQCYKITKQGGG